MLLRPPAPTAANLRCLQPNVPVTANLPMTGGARPGPPVSNLLPSALPTTTLANASYSSTQNISVGRGSEAGSALFSAEIPTLVRAKETERRQLLSYLLQEKVNP